MAWKHTHTPQPGGWNRDTFEVMKCLMGQEREKNNRLFASDF